MECKHGIFINETNQRRDVLGKTICRTFSSSISRLNCNTYGLDISELHFGQSIMLQSLLVQWGRYLTKFWIGMCHLRSRMYTHIYTKVLKMHANIHTKISKMYTPCYTKFPKINIHYYTKYLEEQPNIYHHETRILLHIELKFFLIFIYTQLWNRYQYLD